MKLTINIDPDLLKKAESIAEQRQQTLSEVFNQLLSEYVNSAGRSKQEILDLISEMAGSYGPLAVDIDPKSERHKHLDEKYLEVKTS